MFPQHHKIEHLWELAVTIMNKVFIDETEPVGYLSVAKHVVEEFSKIDPGFFCFQISK